MDLDNESEQASERRARALTEADIEALAEKIVEKSEAAIISRFYKNLGMGVWGLIWKAIVLGLIALAAYGAATGKR